jgi:hypothetical protein
VGSAYGDSLAEEFEAKFTTSTINVLSSFPSGGGRKRDCGMFVKFDQYVDPEEVLQSIKVTSSWNTQYALRLMTMEEVNASPFWRINTPRYRFLFPSIIDLILTTVTHTSQTRGLLGSVQTGQLLCWRFYYLRPSRPRSNHYLP